VCALHFPPQWRQVQAILEAKLNREGAGVTQMSIPHPVGSRISSSGRQVSDERLAHGEARHAAELSIVMDTMVTRFTLFNSDLALPQKVTHYVCRK
jgi:hypothetical protein